MKNVQTKLVSLLLVSCISLTTGACANSTPSGGEGQVTTVASTTADPTPTPVPACPDQVLITQGDIVFGQIYEGYYLVDCEHMDTLDLTYNYQPRDVNIAVEEWSSSDESVATVDSNGKVTPIGFGECEITLHVTDGLTDGAYTSINVTVQDGIIRMEDYDIPSYDQLRTNLCDDYGLGRVDVYDTYYTNYSQWSDNYCEGPFIFCNHYTDEYYAQYASVEGTLEGDYTHFIVCQNGQCTITIYTRGVYVFCDEYFLGISCVDPEEAVDIAECVGFTIPRDQIDLSKLSL